MGEVQIYLLTVDIDIDIDIEINIDIDIDIDVQEEFDFPLVCSILYAIWEWKKKSRTNKTLYRNGSSSSNPERIKTD